MSTTSEAALSLRRANLSEGLASIAREVNTGRAILEPGHQPWSPETIARWLEDPSFGGGRYVYQVFFGSEMMGVVPCQRFADDLFVGDVYLRAPLRQIEPLMELLALLLEQALLEETQELLVETGFPLSVPSRVLHSAGFRYKRNTYLVSRAPLPARILTPEVAGYSVALEPRESISGQRLRSLYDRLYRPSASDWPEAPSAIDRRLRQNPEIVPILAVMRSTRKEVGYALGKFDPTRRNFHIEEVGVDQELRGHQLSRVLLAAIVEAARESGAGSLSARIQSDNKVAVHLVRRLGFRVDRSLRVYAATPRKIKNRGNLRMVLDPDAKAAIGPDAAIRDELGGFDELLDLSSGLPSARATLHRPSDPAALKPGRVESLAIEGGGDDDEDDDDPGARDEHEAPRRKSKRAVVEFDDDDDEAARFIAKATKQTTPVPGAPEKPGGHAAAKAGADSAKQVAAKAPAQGKTPPGKAAPDAAAAAKLVGGKSPAPAAVKPAAKSAVTGKAPAVVAASAKPATKAPGKVAAVKQPSPAKPAAKAAPVTKPKVGAKTPQKAPAAAKKPTPALKKSTQAGKKPTQAGKKPTQAGKKPTQAGKKPTSTKKPAPAPKKKASPPVRRAR